MKMIFLVAITLCVFMVACNSLTESEKVKNYIPGTYISSWKTEFSQSVDTLLIEPLMKQGSETYYITRRTHIIFLNNSRPRVPEYRIRHWTGIYDASNKTVVLNSDGSVLSFDPINKEMKRGITSYRKL